MPYCFADMLGPFADIQGSFVEIKRRRAKGTRYMTLFCGYIGLFCGYIGLFCGFIVLFCRDTEQASNGCAIPMYPHKRDRCWSAKEPYVFTKEAL